MNDEGNDIKLTAKQELFCQRYLIDFNATKAAKEAGYSEDSAYAIGWENLKKPEIQARISELRKEMGDKFNVTRERIAQELALIAFGDTKIIFDEYGRLKPPSEWTDEGRVIASYEESVTEFGTDDNGGTKTTKKVRQWDKIKAIEALNRLMGYNEPDKFDHTTGGDKINRFDYSKLTTEELLMLKQLNEKMLGMTLIR